MRFRHRTSRNRRRSSLNDSSDEVQLARTTMLEIANSARQPWVAYGDQWQSPSWILLNRHAHVWVPLVCSTDIYNVARTELGRLPPGASKARRSDLLASALKFNLDCFITSGKVRVFQLATMDQISRLCRPVATTM